VKKLQPFYKAFALLIVFNLVACQQIDQQAAVDRVLEARNIAMSEKNIEAYAQLLDDDYYDKLKFKSDMTDIMQGLFKRFQRIQMHSYNRHIRIIDSEHAQCEQNYTLTVVADATERKLTQREQLELIYTPNGWKIHAGL